MGMNNEPWQSTGALANHVKQSDLETSIGVAAAPNNIKFDLE